MNGQGGGLRKRRKECERGERYCRVITESSYSLVRLAARSMCVYGCVYSVAVLKLCADTMSEWVVKFAHSNEQVHLCVCKHECVFLDVLMVHPDFHPG